MSTQKAAIRAALKRGRKLTPIDALKEFGCFRLGARIYELKREGLNVRSRLKNVNGKSFAEYYLGRA